MAAPEMYQDKDKVVIPVEAWKKIREALALPEEPEEAVAELLQTLPNTRKKNGNWRKLQGCLKGIASTKDLEEEHCQEARKENESCFF